MNATESETIDTYRAELEASGRVEREGVTLTHEPGRMSEHRRPQVPAPWVLDYGPGDISTRWQDLGNALRRFYREVTARLNRRLAPIREAQALAARMAQPVTLSRLIDVMESAASWIENTPDEMTGETGTVAQELRAAVEVLRKTDSIAQP